MSRARDLAAFVSNADGDIKFDTDTLFIDSSTNRVGLGTNQPSVQLDIESTAPTIRLTDSDATGTPESEVSGAGGDVLIKADRDNEKSDTVMGFEIDGDRKATIDHLGNFMIGRETVGSAGVGHVIRGADSAIFSRDATGETVQIGRNASDGMVVRLNSNGAHSGQIGLNGAYAYIGSGHVNLRFHNGADVILPALSNGNTRTDLIDIGSAGGRFKDIHTSGGIYLGGNATNRLDDYETGTWNISDGSGAGLSYSISSGSNVYTKIGRMVFATVNLEWPSTGNGALARLVLPFNASPHGSAVGGVIVEQNYSSSDTLTAAINYTNGVIFRRHGLNALTNANLSGKRLRFTVVYHQS